MLLRYYLKTLSMISTMRHPRSCFLCFFLTIPINFPFQVTAFLFYLSLLFAVLEESIQARTFGLTKKKYDLLPCIPIVPLYLQSIQIGIITVAEIMYAK